MFVDPEVAEKLKERNGVAFFPRVKGKITAEGLDVAFEAFSQHPPGQFMPLGSYSYSQSYLGNVSRIGRYCSIGAGIEIMGAAHPTDWASSSPAFYRARRARRWGSAREAFPPFEDSGPPVEIGNDVWIGNDVLLAHGITIGTGSIIAARSVVTRSVPPYAIVGGAPAKTIRWRFDEKTIERLLAIKWWRWPLEAWDEIDPSDISEFLDHAAALEKGGDPMPEKRFTARDLLSEMK